MIFRWRIREGLLAYEDSIRKQVQTQYDQAVLMSGLAGGKIPPKPAILDT